MLHEYLGLNIIAESNHELNLKIYNFSRLESRIQSLVTKVAKTNHELKVKM